MSDTPINTCLLARREAAITTLPFSRTESRSTRIEYIQVPTAIEEVNIIYRLPAEEDLIDLTYLNIVHQDFVLYMVGPLLVLAILGAIIHVLTSSCSTPVSDVNLKSLTTFPDHICFHTERKYKVQSGLILRTSWAIFWFILSSAYSAYLVTTFTVKTPELTIKTINQLLEHEDYKFGITAHDTALQSFIKSSSDDTLRSLWKKLQEFNKTDPTVFHASLSVHLDRLLHQKYALLFHTSLDILPMELYPDVRTFHLKGFEEINHAYISTPRNVFYSSALSSLLLAMEESGVLPKIRSEYLSKQNIPIHPSKVGDLQAVTFQRIKLPVYIVSSCIALCLTTLLLEFLVHKIRQGVKMFN